jgi:hypothetical protein
MLVYAPLPDAFETQARLDAKMLTKTNHSITFETNSLDE